MNAKTAQEMTVVELRKFASSLGIKNVAKFTKAALQDEILTAEQAKVLAAVKAPKASKVKATKAPKVGAIVGGKRMSPSAYEAAGIENEHNDGHHVDAQPADCLQCFPKVARATGGTSRAGMTMSVKIHATGVEKAAGVVEAIEAKTALSCAVSSKPKSGVVHLAIKDKAADLTALLVWETNGAYRYDLSNISGHKVRNVKAALRKLGAL